MIFKAKLLKPITFQNSTVFRFEEQWKNVVVISHKRGRQNFQHNVNEIVYVEKDEEFEFDGATYYKCWNIYLDRGDVIRMNSLALREYLMAFRDQTGHLISDAIGVERRANYLKEYHNE